MPLPWRDGTDEPGAPCGRCSARAALPRTAFSGVRYRTPTKTRILAGAPHAIKQQIVLYDVEDMLPEDPALSAGLIRALREAAQDADGAILSDYGYGAVSPDAVAPLRAALPDGTRICVDSRHRLPRYVGVDAATPNEEELEESAGETIETEEGLAKAGSALRDRMRCDSLLVTRGSRGMALFDGEAPRMIPVHGTDQVADVTGAGDTVLAAFALSLSAGGSPLEAALLANFAGSVVVMKMGTSVTTPEELAGAVEADRTLLS